MLLERAPFSIVIVCCIMIIYSLFYIKEEVVNARIELQEINKQLNQEQDHIHILKAEFAYLTCPSRLQKLNEHYVKLQETRLAQLVDDIVPGKQKHNVQIAQAPSKKTPWRYKQGPTQYITLVSAKKK